MSIYIKYCVIYDLLLILFNFPDAMYVSGFILLIESRSKASGQIFPIRATLGIGLVIVFASLLIAMARQKLEEYPFRYMYILFVRNS